MRILVAFVLLTACSQAKDADSGAADVTLGDQDASFVEKDTAKDALIVEKDVDLDAKDTATDIADANPDGLDANQGGLDVNPDGLEINQGGLEINQGGFDANPDGWDANPDGFADIQDVLAPDDAVIDALSDIAPDVPVLNSKLGCSDGSREGYNDLALFPTIAACGGAWDQPGIFNMPAKCNRQAGNDGTNAPGTGCTVSDLCVAGWHVCYGKDDVVFRNADGCAGVMTGATPPVFFTTQMSSTGAFMCASGANATNDLFGCGNLGCDFTGNATVKTMCAPLGLSSHDMCKGLRNDLGCGDWCNHLGKYPGAPNSWDCGTDSTKEALNVVKTHPEQQGGVLCCLD